MKATEHLINEHEEILFMSTILNAVVQKLERGIKVNPLHLEAILNFLVVFIDQFHHEKEEKLLFPALVLKGIPRDEGPIALMLAEHENSRISIKGLSDAVTAYRLGNSASIQEIIVHAQSYLQHLNLHIAMENNVLFKLADSNLSEGEQELLVREFYKMEEDAIGCEKHGLYQKMLMELKSIYL
jgi:hemerythrin-like domain-containing protein